MTMYYDCAIVSVNICDMDKLTNFCGFAIQDRLSF
jgi:hypothetical protein